jgi:hypothetical protein
LYPDNRIVDTHTSIFIIYLYTDTPINVLLPGDKTQLFPKHS